MNPDETGPIIEEEEDQIISISGHVNTTSNTSKWEAYSIRVSVGRYSTSSEKWDSDPTPTPPTNLSFSFDINLNDYFEEGDVYIILMGNTHPSSEGTYAWTAIESKQFPVTDDLSELYVYFEVDN